MLVVRHCVLPKMQESAVDEFSRVAQRSMPSTNAEGARKPILIFFEVLPAEGTTAAFEFCGNRHVPLAAQRSKLANSLPK